MSVLDNVQIVLVNPSVPGNIGATARALKNTGINRLLLVNPGPWDTPDARRMAHGSAEILDACQVFPDLPAAITSSSLVVGTTHRRGRDREITAAADVLIERIVTTAQNQRVSVVFGREKDGLWLDELQYCHELLHFPTAVDYPSLNLSHAVLLTTYKLYIASLQPLETPSPPGLTSAEREQLSHHLLAALDAIDFEHYNGDPDHFMRILRRVLSRAELSGRDAVVLHKICGQIEKFSVRQSGSRPKS